MRSINRHIIFGRLFLLLFVVANSGFTAILYHCNMLNRMEAMPCCEIPGSGSTKASTGSQLPEGSELYSVGFPCYTLHLAGGLQTHPSVLVRESSAKNLKTSCLVALDPAICSLSSSPQSTASYVASASNTPRSSVEKYVLNASLLI